MSGFFKNYKKLAVALAAILLAVTVATGSLAYLVDADAFAPKTPEIVDGTSHGNEDEIEADPEDADDEDMESDTEVEAVFAAYNMPGEMRGVYITPGVDFLKTTDTSEKTMRADIDAAIAAAKKLTMNTVIIDTVYSDKVIFQTVDAPELTRDFDMMAYIVEKARDEGLYTCAIFDISMFRQRNTATSALAVGIGSPDRLGQNIREFAEKYELDAILIDGYENQPEQDSYLTYITGGSSIGFGNFMRQTPTAAVTTAAEAIRASGAPTQVGLLASAVWANDGDVEGGSATKAVFTSLESGNADTRSFVEKGLVDFVAVKAFTSLDDASVPFGAVVSWWAEVALKNDMPMYVVHASDKICTEEAGWKSQDQLARQVIEATGVNGFRGSIFNNLKRLSEDPKQAATTLMKYYNEDTTPELILKELEMTKPESTSFTTAEPAVTFTGASDPNAEVTINGEVIKTDESGYFTSTMQLAAGENKFVIAHKEKSISYTITRKIQILKEASPTGDVLTEGSVSLSISAVAYQEASVSATIGGQSITLYPEEDAAQDVGDRDSLFTTFRGEYTVPAATSSVQSLGKIVVTASWGGQSESITAGSVQVNKRAKIEDGVPVIVIADQARTYPPDKLNNIPDPNYYPLPKGAHDYVIGDEVVYKKDSSTSYSYYVLASGMRVETKDVAASGENDYVSNNTISGISVTSEGGFTFVTVKTMQQVSYFFKYTNDAISIRFNNTVKTPDSMNLSKNPLFSKAAWSGNDTLTLTLVQQAGFMGYKGYYDTDGNLVLKFNNPPSSISNARIAIDPGHGGKDVGALGFLADYPEKVINRAIAQKLADELTSRGATVLLLDTSNGMSLEERVRQAEKFNADLMVSVHSNTAPRAEAAGTEVYYFYPFGWRLANNAAKSVSGQLSTTNRGPKASYYHVTLSSQVPSVLVETGFLSNRAEYEKLIKSSYQSQIATGIADAISSTIKATYTGIDSGGSEGTGSKPATTTTPDGDRISVEDIDISDETITVGIDKSFTLTAEVYPPDATDTGITWKSGNTAVATVSDSGKVTGVKAGTATITATSNDGGHKVKCTVTVSADAADEGSSTGDASSTEGAAFKDSDWVDFDELDVVMYVNSTHEPVIINERDNKVRRSDFTWKSSRTSVATVNSSGIIKAGSSAGTAEITATAKADSDYYIVMTVEVSKSKVKVTSISFGQSDYAIVRGKTLKLAPTLSPSGATVSSLTWTTSDKKVAQVDTSGTVTAINPGTATITAKDKSTGVSETVTIEVTLSTVKVEYIDLDSYNFEMSISEEMDIFYDVDPPTATDKAVTFTSSNTRVATVDKNGVVKALAKGKTIITIRSVSNSSVYEECEIVVLD